MLTKDQILSADDIKSTTVQVPEWGGDVRVLILSGTARDALQDRLASSGKASSEYEAALIVSTVVDDNGSPIFTTEDVPALRAKSSAALRRVASAAMKWNRMGPEAEEDAEKNSAAAQSGSSGTE